MTLFNALRKLTNMEVFRLIFSSATAHELVLKTFDQHSADKYGTEGGGFGDHQIIFGSNWSAFSLLEFVTPQQIQVGLHSLKDSFALHHWSWLITLEKHHSSKSMGPLTELLQSFY
ncbi:hypothetical protein BY996DRAFT_7512702 [Phakopsora pachyrhizi]|nr:hypothetical protein BY996DRAFT_8105069 [Phakopsora pachyrhizi]KAI8446333.1 hypothetical protein BY996DRAFT_7840106 [Phakopsora pachyrhizi]KAI8449139.1 hypothetical protein BY996DRAFT_7512702 [Phakopsora pachyrhizi]